MDRVKQRDYKTSMVAKFPTVSSATATVVVAIGCIVWRVAVSEPTQFWKDWVLITSAFWIYTQLKGDSPSWPVVTMTTMAYLFGVYLLGQLPHTLAVLGIGV